MSGFQSTLTVWPVWTKNSSNAQICFEKPLKNHSFLVAIFEEFFEPNLGGFWAVRFKKPIKQIKGAQGRPSDSRKQLKYLIESWLFYVNWLLVSKTQLKKLLDNWYLFYWLICLFDDWRCFNMKCLWLIWLLPCPKNVYNWCRDHL